MSTCWGTCRPNIRLQANQKGARNLSQVARPRTDPTEEQEEGPESRKRLCASFQSQGLFHHLCTEVMVNLHSMS